MRSSRENERSFGRKRLSIFVDANTIVSALFFEGNEALLLKLGATGACRLVTSEYVLREVANVLRAREFRINRDEIPGVLQFIHRAVVVRNDVAEKDLKEHYARLDDKKVVTVLTAFEKFKGDLLVTGDKELLTKVRGAETTKRAIEMILRET